MKLPNPFFPENLNFNFLFHSLGRIHLELKLKKIMIRVLFLSILALVQISGQTVDPRVPGFGVLHQHSGNQPPIAPGTGGAGVPPVRPVHHHIPQHPWNRQGRSIPVGNPQVVAPNDHKHSRQSHVFHPHNGPAMMNFVPHTPPEVFQSHRQRRAAPAVGPASLPLRGGGHPHMQHFQIQQQHMAALHQAALRRGGNGEHHVIKQRSVSDVEERFAMRPIPASFASAGFAHHQPPRQPLGHQPLGHQPLGHQPLGHKPLGHQRGIPRPPKLPFGPGQKVVPVLKHPNSPRNLPFVAGNYDPDQPSTTTAKPKASTTTAKSADKSNSWF